MSAPAPHPLGSVAHYNLLEPLEPAGPGDLYRARDTHRGRTVVVRLLPRNFPVDAAARATLLERAHGLAALSHPNITTLFDAGEHEGRLYLVFEFLHGASLRAEMSGRPINPRRAVELAIQISDAVADAHAAGFVHGGLSPDSIVVTSRGRAKIPAFELASRSGFEQAGGDVRLRDYDAPEEASGAGADERSDVYSVGAILYEMVTMKRPMHKGAAAPSAANIHVPRELDDVVLRAVAPNPDSRHQSAAAFAAELRGVAALLESREIAQEVAEHSAQRSTNVGRVLLIAGLTLLVLAAIAWWVWGG